MQAESKRTDSGIDIKKVYTPQDLPAGTNELYQPVVPIMYPNG